MPVTLNGVTATGGIISFVDTVSDATCDITGCDEHQLNQRADFTVNLPAVSVTAPSSAGKYVSATRFIINLCGQNSPNGLADAANERASGCHSGIITQPERYNGTSVVRSSTYARVKVAVPAQVSTDI